MLDPDLFGPAVDKAVLLPGIVYAIPEKAGHILAVRADVADTTYLAILAVVGTSTLDRPPVLVQLSSIAGTQFHPLKNGFVAPRHNAGEARYDSKAKEPLKHGDFVEDNQKRQFLYIEQKGFSPLMLSLEEGAAYPAFEPTLLVHRWTIRSGTGDASSVIAAYGGD